MQPAPSLNRFEPQVPQKARFAASDEAYHVSLPVMSTWSRRADVAATWKPLVLRHWRRQRKSMTGRKGQVIR